MKYGRLSVVDGSEYRIGKRVVVTAICDCGVKKQYSRGNLRNGHTQSCGCLWHEQKHRARKIKHGYYGSRTYASWHGIKDRCLNLSSVKRKDYSGRGIKMCESWKKFENFLADMGDRPSGTTIDRIDVNGDYCKENCRWATYKEQAENKRNTHKITYKDKTQTINEWSKELNVPRSTIYSRYVERKLSPEISLGAI